MNCKTIIKHNCSSANVSLLNHHLIKKNNLINLDKLYCWELNKISIYTSPRQPASQIYFANFFRELELNWKEIYILPRKASLHFDVRSFHYKVLNNVLYLYKKLFFRKSPFLCSSCKQADETILYLFYECNITKELWNRLDLFFNDCFHLPQLLLDCLFWIFLS